MNTTTAEHADLIPTSALTGEPRWLAVEPEPIYAVLHTPAPESLTGTAAVLLPAFGWDDECSYRRRRDWATQLASSGVMAARFDFPGRENSAGSPLARNRAQSWVAATVEAARWLRDRSGCERLVAIGVGLGGLIAYQAILDEAPIDDLVLWGVRASGSAYVRELRAYAAVTAPADEEDAVPDGALGIGGHVMSVETAATLSSIELTKRPLPDAADRRVLLIGRDSHGVDARLRDHLAGSGAQLTLLESDEYLALMSPPDLGLSPAKTVSATVEWIAAVGDAGSSAGAGTTAPAPTQSVIQGGVTESVVFEHDGVPIRERLATVETEQGVLRGVISEPLSGPRGSCCLVTVNSGALRHTGPNRMFVELGRRAAASGVPAARFDLPGLGDSDGEAIRSFERTEADDGTSLALLKSIYDHLEQLGLADRFVAGGFSLGGYLTVRVATTDSRVTGALCVNPTGFVWTDKQRKRLYKDLVAVAGPDALLAGTHPARGAHGISRLRDRLERLGRSLDAAARRRLARSDFLWRIEHRRELAGLGGRLDELAQSGTGMLLLLSKEEQLLRMLRRPGPAEQLRRCPGIRVELLPSRDHLLRPLSIQEIVIERFAAALTEFCSATGANANETANDRPG